MASNVPDNIYGQSGCNSLIVKCKSGGAGGGGIGNPSNYSIKFNITAIYDGRTMRDES